MGLLDDAKAKAAELANNNPDKLEQVSDQALDRAAQVADEKTGSQHTDKINQGRDFLDGKIGQ